MNSDQNIGVRVSFSDLQGFSTEYCKTSLIGAGKSFLNLFNYKKEYYILLLGYVTGTVWGTCRDKKLTSLKLLLFGHVEMDYVLRKSYTFATDKIDTGVVKMVCYLTTDEAIIPLENKPALYDASIVGI